MNAYERDMYLNENSEYVIPVIARHGDVGAKKFIFYTRRKIYNQISWSKARHCCHL